MRVHTPRIIATDLDGTLLRSDGSLSDRTRAAIISAEDAGITTVFVTARPPRWLDALADAVGPHGTAICGNGAFVYDVPNRAVTAQYPLEDALLRELVRDLRLAVPGITFAVECADGMGRERGFMDRFSAEFASGDLAEISLTPVGKLLGRCAEFDSEEFLDHVMSVLAGRAELGYSGASDLAEITGPGVTKASGLARWCDACGVDAAEVWAFGDMPNDLPMLRWAGRSYAVSNAHPDVLAVADDVLASNDDDGVAQVLEALVQA